MTVEIKQNSDNKVIDGYEISGGDEEALRQIGSKCFFLLQAFKDTPLDTPSARLQCPALKHLYTLLAHLPKFAERYLEIEGIPPRMHDVRLAEIETKRKELLLVQKEWLAETTALRKGASGKETGANR